MNKLTIATGALSLTLLLGACGDPDTEQMEKASTAAVKEAEETKAKVEEETEAKEQAKADGKWETEVGETVENEGGTFTLHGRNDQVAPQTTGPMKLNITQVNKTSGVLKGEMKAMFDSEVANYVQVDMEVENTSEDTVNFYPDQATITTSTGEQVTSEFMMSDDVGGEFIGPVKKQGSVFFFLKNSKAEDLEWVRLIVTAPSNADFETIGDDIDIKVEF
ncbi:hypothetical protein [Bacillus sp. 7894-2]|uniref:hypothetical protein n=1 Tax=Bacillus sp. 7894-2 TaxID=2021695 RepID=UPI000BA59D53|nr:hypothetical protein [Bacillus sp. 7894-2]PAE24052.1 hypothetical protein CHI10_14710 [Bacillus sp. 7894-2]